MRLGDRGELPVVGARAEGQLQYPERVGAAGLTVRPDLVERTELPAARANDELAIAGRPQDAKKTATDVETSTAVSTRTAIMIGRRAARGKNNVPHPGTTTVYTTPRAGLSKLTQRPPGADP